MKIFVAGPMSDIVALNYPTFHAEAARLRSLGHDVVSPAEINADLLHEGWAACMKRDIPAMLTCDAVQLLHGWQDSTGAKLERHVACQLGLVVYSPNAPVQARA